MKSSFEHLPQTDRKKILLICDDIRVNSGVATVAREIVIHTSHHFNWVNIAGSVTHPEKGKRLDLSSDTNKHAEIEDSSVILYPVDGYGNPDLLRQIIQIEKPDALLLITDPRYFEWVFAMENELRKKLPIAYLNIWDEYPAPLYNKAFYEACDLLMGISKQTVNINRLVLEEKASSKVLKYVPHGLNPEIFYPISKEDPNFNEFTLFKKNILGNRDFDFVVFFNSRNIRRKQIPDTMLAFRYFLDTLPKEKAEKCALLLHTEIVSEHGTDLMAIKELFFEGYEHNVIFTPSKYAPKEMNYLYNLSDVQILISSNEGWGLSLTEAILAGNPIIANVTGGMQDQMRFTVDNKWIEFDSNIPSNHTGFSKNYGEWAFPVYPTNRSIQGSPKTPYIWDDRCNAEDAATRIAEVYALSKEERKSIGLKGREWATSEEAGFTSFYQAERVMNAFTSLFQVWKPREKFEFINATQAKPKVLRHKLLY